MKLIGFLISSIVSIVTFAAMVTGCITLVIIVWAVSHNVMIRGIICCAVMLLIYEMWQVFWYCLKTERIHWFNGD